MKKDFSSTRFLAVFLLVPFAVVSCIHRPDRPVDPSPADKSSVQGNIVSLCATLGDPIDHKLQVRFFGRTKTSETSRKFTIILLPDTQHYTGEPQGLHGGKAEMFDAQTKWIAANRATMNIVYVGQLGDCVQNGDSLPGPINEIEWKRSQSAIKYLEDPLTTSMPQGIPFGISVGNHDETPNGRADGTTRLFNKYFGSDHFAGRAYYGGHYGTNNNNFYDVFEASGTKFMVISFQFDQSSTFFSPGGPLDWGEQLVKSNPDRKVIVMTHYALNETSSFSVQGKSIYERLKIYPNFSLMVCGHMHIVDGEANRTDIYEGNRVHTLLSNYQSRPGGGNGLLRIMEFDPVQSRISVKTYSPYNNRWETDPNSQFELPFNLLPLLGTTNDVTPGANACFSWKDLSPHQSYEWNIESYNGQAVTIGPIWNFSTQ